MHDGKVNESRTPRVRPHGVPAAALPYDPARAGHDVSRMPGRRVTSTAWRDDLRAALPGWVAGRALVALAWLVNWVSIELWRDGESPIQTTFGLFAWDGAYYRDLAELGYAAANFDAVRFHPLLPVLGGNGTGVLLVGNLAALLAAAVLHRLVVEVCDDADLARRVATLVALAPPAFSTVWAYAEGPFLLIAAGFLLLLHRRQWWGAAALGVLASLTRPNGLLLALPAAIEGWRWLRADPHRRWAGPVAAVAAPVVGLVAFLGWVERELGDGLRPLRIQDDLRGGFVFPPFRLVEALGEVVANPLGDGLHTPFVLLSMVLVWVGWRRGFPVSWTALAGASVVTFLAADNLNSTERYAYGTVPLLVALGAVTGGRRWRPVLAVCVLGLVGMTTLAWHGRYVP